MAVRHFVCIIHMKSIELVRELAVAGWRLERIGGSHHVFKHPQQAGILVVPLPKKNWGLV